MSVRMMACRRLVCVALALVMLLSALPASAEHEHVHLRAGFFSFDGYHNMDNAGARSGYGYDLLQLIARYAHVNYDYLGFEKTLSENLAMLERGEIDFVSAIKKTPERLEKFDFTDRDVGSASTILTIKAGNMDVIAGSYSTYDGMRIGVMKDGTRAQELAAFAQEHEFRYEPVFFNNTHDMSAALQAGEVDALVTSSLRLMINEWVLDSFNHAPIYIAVRKGNTEALALFNFALDRMEREEYHWRVDLEQKYYSGSYSPIPFLNGEERAYLQKQNTNGRIYRVLVNPERFPYSYIKDGQLVGIMPDLFDIIAQRAGIRYEWMIPTDREDYAQRMLNRETDICIDLTPDYDTAEKNGYSITDMYLTAPFSWIRRNDSGGDISHAAQLTYIARTPAFFAYANTYHNIDYTSYATEQECLEAVLDRKTDAYCTYTFNAEKLVLEDPSGTLMATVAQTENQFAIGVAKEVDRHLVSILNTVLSCLYDWERTEIIRRHTSFSAPTFTPLELIENNATLLMTLVLGAAVCVLMAVVIIQQIRHQKSLKRTIRIQNRRLDDSMKNMLDVLATAIEFRSSESGDHVHRIRDIVHDVLRELQRQYPQDYPMDENTMEQIANASVLHDVGKIAISDHILNKPGRLNKEEFEAIKQHTLKGCAMLETLPDIQAEPLYRYAWDISRWHHERWDGRGYPDGLAGNDIPIWSQVVAVADVYDALISSRVYKTAYSREKALSMIRDGECGAFNPKLLDAFFAIADKLPEPTRTSMEQSLPYNRDLTSLMLNSFRTLMENTDLLAFVKDADGAYRAVSSAYAKCAGKTADEMLCHTDRELLIDEKMIERFENEDRQVINTGVDIVLPAEVITIENGVAVYGTTTKRLISDSQGRVMGILGMMKNVTAQYNAQKHQEIKLQPLHNPPTDMFFFTNIDITDWKIMAERRQTIGGVGFQAHNTAEELFTAAWHNITDYRSPAYAFYRSANQNSLYQAYEEGRTKIVLEYQRRMSDGNNRWVRDELNFHIDPVNGHLCMTLGVYDIQERKDMELRLIAQAERDELTGLLNRAAVRRLITERLQQHNDQRHALFMIDIDNLKQANDQLGHLMGDQCLVRVGEILRTSFRTKDLAARIGGDEFIVLMTDITDKSFVKRKAEQLLERLQFRASEDSSITISASIGVSFFPEDGDSRETLYKRADTAMYHAKHHGKNQISFFNKSHM